jgi:peptide/nickel transport system ATP-binding protein
MAMIVIAHDLGDIARLCDRTAVLYAGRMLEIGSTTEILDDPAHPYTWGLVNAYPLITRTKDLWGIRGLAPDPADPPRGCRFQPRCTQSIEECCQKVPSLGEPAAAYGKNQRLVACHRGGLLTMLSVDGLRKVYRCRGRQTVEAVRNATIQIREGEVVGLVGESGSGKSTLARLIVGLEAPDAGSVRFEGEELAGRRLSELARRRIQLIFQDPYEALSPRLTVMELIREPLDIQRIGSRRDREDRVREVLAAVNLPTQPAFLGRYTDGLSGGQLQRIAVARALVLQPKLIIADEPVSMLDASESAKLIRLLKRLQNERGMAMLFISHELALVRKVADRIAVMRNGEIVEFRPSHLVLSAPRHPYTQSLIAASQALLAPMPMTLVSDERSLVHS